MKKIILLLLLPAVIFSGCVNLDEVEQRLNNHEARLVALETMLKQINNDILAMQALIDAISKNNSIVSYEPLDNESGYELIMSDGKKIVLKHGIDGNFPVISAKKHTDGVFYWVIDGEFMLDSNNKMIPAESKNGKNGIIPKLRVNEDNQWEVSLNDGQSWELMWDENGKPLYATGDKGEINLNITETATTVIINYGGQVYIIEKAKIPVSDIILNINEKTMRVGDSFTLSATISPAFAADKSITWISDNDLVVIVDTAGVVTAIGEGVAIITATTADGNKTATCKIITQIRPKLSIEYLTEYNINADGTHFTYTHANDAAGYFTWNSSMSHFAINANFAIDGIAYHLPTQKEWFGIIPDYNSGQNVKFDAAVKTLDFTEQITIAGQTKEYTSDYIGTPNSIAYGLRFKGQNEEHRSAWRYSYTDNPLGGKMMTITVRYLGSNLINVSIDDIAQESWWENNASGDIERILPAIGHTGKFTDDISYRGTSGYYWTATLSSDDFAKVVVFNGSFSYSGTTYSISDYGLGVRLFYNK